MAMAGLYEFWRDRTLPGDHPLAWWVTCTVVTTEAETTPLAGATSEGPRSLAATSPGITVIGPPPPVLTVNATTAPPGGSVTVTLTNGVGGSLDWLELAATTAPATSYLQWTWVGAGVTTRTWTVTMPTTPGTYEFRLLLNDSFTITARSPAVTVTP